MKKIFRIEKDNKKALFFRLLLSNIIILLLPAIIVSVFFHKIEFILTENAHKANQAMMEQVSQVIDHRFKEIENLALQISHNPKLQKLLYYKDSSNYEYIELVKELAKYQFPSTLIHDLYIYFTDRNIVLSPTMKTNENTFLRYIGNDENLLFTKLINEKLSTYHFMNYYPSMNNKENLDKNYLTFVQTLPYGEKMSYNAAFMLRIDEYQIREMLEKIDGMNEGGLFIFNDRNDLLLSTSADRQFFPPIEFLSNPVNQFESSDQLIFTKIYSTRNNWTYVSVFPKKVVLAQVQILKSWAITLLIILFSMGMFISYYLASRNYRPIQNIVNTIIEKNNHIKYSAENEIEIIDQTITNLYSEYDKLNKLVLYQMPIVRTDFITRLVKGHIDTKTVQKEDLKSLGVSMKGDFFSVLLIQIENESHTSGYPEEDWSIARLVILNICNNILNEKGFAVEFDQEQILLIINHMDNAAEDRVHKEKVLTKLRNAIEGNFNLQMSVAVSEIHKGIDKIVECYREVIMAFEYRFVLGINSIIYFSDIKKYIGQYEYNFPIETEIQLINFTKQGDFKNVSKILDEIYEMNLKVGHVTPNIGKCLAFDLLSTWFKLLSNFDYEQKDKIVHRVNPFKVISKSKTMMEMHENLKHLFYELCIFIKERQTDPSYKLYQRILYYVNEKFSDPMFSLSSMADHFQMNPSYLSTFFKKQSGRNISEVVAELRVNASKKMLENNKLTVSEIATKVGYANSVGFIRVFKKFEGMPPGQYRDGLVNLKF